MYNRCTYMVKRDKSTIWTISVTVSHSELYWNDHLAFLHLINWMVLNMDRYMSVYHFKCLLDDMVVLHCSCFGWLVDTVAIYCFYLTFSTLYSFYCCCISFLSWLLFCSFYFFIYLLFSLLYITVARHVC